MDAIKKLCICKIKLLTPEYFQKCTCNKTLNIKTNLWTPKRHMRPVVGLNYLSGNPTLSQWVVKGEKHLPSSYKKSNRKLVEVKMITDSTTLSSTLLCKAKYCVHTYPKDHLCTFIMSACWGCIIEKHLSYIKGGLVL